MIISSSGWGVKGPPSPLVPAEGNSSGVCGGCVFPWRDWTNLTHHACTNLDQDPGGAWCSATPAWSGCWHYCTSPDCPIEEEEENRSGAGRDMVILISNYLHN